MVKQQKSEFTQWSLEILWGRENPIHLSWKILDHEISFYWIKLIFDSLKEERPFRSRFIGFIEGNRNEEFIIKKLNECIKVINSDGRYCIEEKVEIIDQKILNKIHHHFSFLIGNETFQSEFWNESSREVRSAICGLNDYVHELESWDRSVKKASSSHNSFQAYVTNEFYEARGLKISSEWNHLFTLDGDFGDLCLHYDQIGKTWLEVLVDEDEVIHDEDIRPLERLTGSFNINFFETSSQEILNDISGHSEKLKIDLRDSALRLGQCCIGKLENAEKIKEEFKVISRDLCLTKIRLKKNDKTMIERVIDRNLERYFYE